MSTPFVEHLMDLLDGFGAEPRRMFGGHGLFRDNLMFALVADDTLYFKADATSRGEYESRGLGRFTYRKRGKVASLGYYAAPPECLEDADAMRRFAEDAFEVALRAAAAGRRKTPRARQSS